MKIGKWTVVSMVNVPDVKLFEIFTNISSITVHVNEAIRVGLMNQGIVNDIFIYYIA